MITGRGNEGIAAEALCLGVSNYIVKDSQGSLCQSFAVRDLASETPLRDRTHHAEIDRGA